MLKFPKNFKLLYFFMTLFIMLFISLLYADELPEYYIIIDQESLDTLDKNPYDDIYYPAQLAFDDKVYECQVRYRGATSRNHPKKSWKIDLFSDNNDFDCEKLNLNAEYIDNTMLRNHLTNNLYKSMGFPAPKTKHIKLYVNNEFRGVYLCIQNIDEYFLKDNDRQKNSLFKAINHSANMAPLCHFGEYPISWEQKIGDPKDYQKLITLLNKLYYYNNTDFVNNIENMVNVENIINYFAIEFVISSYDCFTKNLFFYLNPKTDLWEIFPWDNDAAWGFSWKGEYIQDYETFYYDSPLKNQLLFQRLLEHEKYKIMFWNTVQSIIDEKFSHLLSEIDNDVTRIQPDIYNDTFKRCTNQEFDDSIIELKSFFTKRKEFLKTKTTFNRPQVANFYCSNPFPTPDSTVTFQVKSSQPQNIKLNIIKDMDWAGTSGFYLKTFPMYDDGNHNDSLAGDLLYGCQVEFKNFSPQLLPYYFSIENYDYPANGHFYIKFNSSHSHAIRLFDEEMNIKQNIQLGSIYKIDNDYTVQLHNNSDKDIDLSYCTLQSGEYWNQFLIPQGTIVQAKKSLYISSDTELSMATITKEKTIGNALFDIAIDDSIALFSPAQTKITSKLCTHYEPINSEFATIVINEINYNSAEAFDVGDWLELYNPNNTVTDISYWSISDGNSENMYRFPANTTILPNDFMIICSDMDDFESGFPNVEKIIGEMDFKLSASGEQLILYDALHNTIDSVAFDDHAPWPESPDGSGATLELINPLLDNNVAQHWAASENFGSPCAFNSRYSKIDTTAQPANNSYLRQNFPNPFNEKTHISFITKLNQKVEIKIYNITGQLVESLTPPTNTFMVTWNTINQSSGVYFYQLVVNNNIVDTKKAVLFK